MFTLAKMFFQDMAISGTGPLHLVAAWYSEFAMEQLLNAATATEIVFLIARWNGKTHHHAFRRGASCSVWEETDDDLLLLTDNDEDDAQTILSLPISCGDASNNLNLSTKMVLIQFL